MMTRRPLMRPAIAILPAVALLLALRSWQTVQSGAKLGADATSADAASADAASAVDLGHLAGERRSSSGASSGRQPRLPDHSIDGWQAFRREHLKLAKVSEYGLMGILLRWQQNPSQRDLIHTCMRSGVPLPDLAISAWVTIQDRALAITGIDCEPESSGGSGDNYAEQFCSCLLSGLPPDAFVELPPELSAADLADYQGPIVLDHWGLR